MNRLDRLFATVLLLQTKRMLTAEQFAAHFGISVRTVYRDMAALGEAGVPIVAEGGVGYGLMRGYHLPPVNFTEAEVSALMTGALLVEGMTDASLSSGIKSALDKIRSAIPAKLANQLSLLESHFRVSGRETDASSLTTLQQAIAARKTVSFSYPNEIDRLPEQHIVDPIGVALYLKNWYLIGFTKLTGKAFDFSVDRMSNVRVSEETFSVRADMDVEGYLQKVMPPPSHWARVLFDADCLPRARQEWPLGVLQEEQLEAGCVLTFATNSWPQIAGWLLSFGSSATVIEPDILREQIADLAQVALQHHRTPRQSPLT